MKNLIIVSTVLFLSTKPIFSQSKIICTEKEQKSKISSDPTIIKTCTMGKFKCVSTGTADYKGRYSYSYKLFKNSNGKFTAIKNEELFNQYRSDLINIINQRVRKDFDEYSKDPNNSECFDGVSVQNISFDDLGISFSDSGLDFNISFGLTTSCFAVDGTIISFTMEEISKYLNK